MKVLVADNNEQGVFGDEYHWCNNGDLLMFGEFQTEDNRKGNEISMCGIKERTFTTFITVKDLDISKDFYKELLSESVEKAMLVKINKDGWYYVDFGDDWGFNKNINDHVDELLELAEQFNIGDKLYCRGRKLFLREKETK
jgi:diaminopimelate epimerase